jgi:hypothetical protein
LALISGYAQPLVVWRVQEVHGKFRDDWDCRDGDAMGDRWT